MAKLKMLDFDNYKFEKELASESFYPLYDDIKVISLRCCVEPTTNGVSYFVYVQPKPSIIKKFFFLEDAIIYYNNKLEEIEGEKYET